MRNRLLAALGSCLLATGIAGAGEPAGDAKDLVASLGSNSFHERETAANKLERLGLSALPALRTARTCLDPEVRRRAELLVEHIELAAASAEQLTVNKVALHYENVPLGTALLDFRARTKIPVSLDVKQVANPLRPITLKTEPLPPWQALEAFCKAAGLREEFAAELLPPKPQMEGLGRRGLHVPPPPAMLTASLVPIVLADGTSLSLPGERGGAVRVIALPHRFKSNRLILGSGEVTLNLDVAPLVGRNWKDILGVRVRQALDADGRPVPVSHRIEAEPTISESHDGNVVIINGRIAMWNGQDSTPVAMPLPNPRLVPLTLRTADRPIRSLKLLEGDVQIEVELPAQPLLKIENLAKAVRTAHDGPNLTKLTIADMFTEPRKPEQTTIKLRLESPSYWMLQQARAQRGIPGAMAMGGIFIEPPIAPTQASQFQVLDGEGRVLSMSSTTYNSGQTDDGTQTFSEIGLTVRGGTPVKLVMIGPRSVTVNVPFRMENVLLP